MQPTRIDDTRPFWSTAPGLAVLVLGSAAYTARLALNWDAAYFLIGARALAEGRSLYTTFPDYSFPANTWLASVSLAIARAAGVVPGPVHQAILFGLCAGSAVLTARLLDPLLSGLPRRYAAPVLFFLFFVLSVQEGGQRDVLFGFGVAPLAMVVLGRAFGREPAPVVLAAAGAMAVAGASLKPHFIAALAAFSLCDLAARGPSRRWLAEWSALGAACAVYLGLVIVLYPTYFSEVLPTASQSYAGYAVPWSEIARRFAWTGIFGVLAAVSLWMLYRDRDRAGTPLPLRPLAPAGLAVAIWTALFLVQRMGFHYHFRALSWVFCGTLALSLIALLEPVLPRSRWTDVAAAVVLGLGVGWQSAQDLDYSLARVVADPMTRALRGLPPGTPIVALETGVPPVSPIVSYADVRWTGEHGSLVELRSIVQDRRRAAETGAPRNPVLVRLEGDVRARMLASFRPFVPDVVLVDVADRDLRWFEDWDQPFTILGFYLEDPEFAAIWADYEPRGTFTSLGFRYGAWTRRGARLPLEGIDP